MTLLAASAAPVFAGVACASEVCCPCAATTEGPAAPALEATCCCAVEEPEAPLPPAPASTPPVPAAHEIAAPAAVALPEASLRLPSPVPAEARPTGPDPPPLWLLHTSFRR